MNFSETVGAAKQVALDAFAIAGYGFSAPRKYELIWVRVDDVKRRILHIDEFNGMHPQSTRRCILRGDWDHQTYSLAKESLLEIEAFKFESLELRIHKNVPWEETPTYRERLATLSWKGGVDGRKSEQEILQRFEDLDNLINFVHRNRSLRPHSCISQKYGPREKGGIPLLVGRNGELILGRGGTHRFFICKLMGVRLVPMALDAIHPASLDIIHELRKLKPF